MAAVRDEDRAALRFAGEGKAHGFRGCRSFIEERGIGHRETGEAGDHRLKIEKGFEAALGDLGLIGGVGGVPAGIFENVPLDDRRRDRSMISLADEGLEHLVFREDSAEFPDGRLFWKSRRQVERVGGADAGGNGGVDEGIEGGVSCLFQHPIEIGAKGTKMTAAEVGAGGHGGGGWARRPEASCGNAPHP